MESSIIEGVPVSPARTSNHAFASSVFDHQIHEFAQGVQCMSEMGEHRDVGELVSQLTKQLERQSSGRKVHPLIWANLVFIMGLIFAAGQQYQRLNDIDTRLRAVGNVDAVSQQIGDLKTAVLRMQERLDRALDTRK